MPKLPNDDKPQNHLMNRIGLSKVSNLKLIDDFEWEVLSLSHNQAFIDYLEQARQRGKREGTIPIEEVRRRLDISAKQNG